MIHTRNLFVNGGRKNLLKLLVPCGLIYLMSVSLTDSTETSENSESDKQIQIVNIVKHDIDDKDSELPDKQLLEELSDDDPRLISYVKKKIVPPASEKYQNLENENIQSGQIGQALEVIKYFSGKKNGIFIEAGAWDGEYLSNTLYLEVCIN